MTISASALIIYFFAINLAGYLMMAADKRRAVKHRRRLRESTLLAVAFLGGSIGIISAMLAVRHKTQKAKFKWLPAVFLFMQLILLIILKTNFTVVW